MVYIHCMNNLNHARSTFKQWRRKVYAFLFGSVLVVLLANQSAMARTISNGVGTNDFEDTLLKDLDENAVVSVLSNLKPTEGTDILFLSGGLGDPWIELKFASSMTVLTPGNQFNVGAVLEESSLYLLLHFDYDEKKDHCLRHMKITWPNADKVTVRDFNNRMQGKLKISSTQSPSEPEGIPVYQLELPAKIKFEDDLRLRPQDNRLVFTHPKKPNVKIIINFKEKVSRTRVIAKGTVFEVSKLEYSESAISHQTKLFLNSKDIESIECFGGSSTPFSTTDFYEIMGNRASISQNTEPPVPIQ